jgi:hypothetical protein
MKAAMIVEFELMCLGQTEACLLVEPHRWHQHQVVVGLIEKFLSPFGLEKKTPVEY